MTRRLATAIVSLIVGLCSGLPLAWMLWHLLTRPEVWSEFHLTAFRLDLLQRTLGYNLSAGVIATLISLPAAVVIGRGRGWIARLVWVLLPVSMFMPSIVYSYGWMQTLRLTTGLPDFQSPGDIARCVWSLATWLSPLPAFVIGLALRTVDANLQQQAMLDGALWRVTLRQLAGPIVASVLLCTVLAVQEFAIYEPSGISVIATEMRMVFDTGAITGGGSGMLQPVAGGSRDATTADQRSRAAAAVATAVPMLIVIAIGSLAAAKLARGVSAADAIDAGDWPPALSAGPIAKILAVAAIFLTAGVPLVSLIVSLEGGIRPAFIWAEFSPAVLGSVFTASLAGLLAIALSAAATAGRSKVSLIANLATFLIGGQLLAIALIRLNNQPGLYWVYDTFVIAVFAYLARFGWIALLAGRFTTSLRWRELRDMAAVDGASPAATTRDVVLPIAWPVLAASAVCVMVLAMTEVSATVLLVPLRPPMLTPALMGWVHIQRSDAMIEASLLMIAAVFVLSLAAVGLAWVGTRAFRMSSPRPVLRERVG